MQRRDIEELQTISGFPAVTITLPTYRTVPDSQQNGIRLKNLARQAYEDLKERTDTQTANALMDRLNTLIADLDTAHMQDGLALFVHKDLARAYQLPFALPEQVTLNHTFITRDLMAAQNRQLRYWVVALGLNETKLFAGNADGVTYSDTGDFPLQFRDDYEVPSNPGALEPKYESFVDERHREFFRRVDAALTEILKSENLPVLLLGVARNLAFFHEVTENERALAGEAAGNYENVPGDQLWAAVMPLVENLRTQQQAAALQEWDAAIGAKRFAAGVEDAWTAAFDGRGDLLLVSEDYSVPGQVDESGRAVSIFAEDYANNAPDVVDDLIELNLSRGGRVAFVPSGTLSQGVGLTLRY